MANSAYSYVRAFEQPDPLLPNTWLIIRIDGRGFHKFSNKYQFAKPNDRRALDLMNEAARSVLVEVGELCLAYGVSDEFSFLFPPTSNLFQRRASKLTTLIVSTFTSYYVYLWPKYFPDTALTPPLPSFDGRAVCYPSLGNLRDYLRWRQVDCHINNLYNTTFWTLIQNGGLTAQEAERRLDGTVSSDKNEILFKEFGINYNKEDEMYKKGSVIFRQYELEPPQDVEAGAPDEAKDDVKEQQPMKTTDVGVTEVPVPVSKSQADKERKRRAKAKVVVEHLDIIKDEFWERRPWILGGKAGKLPT